MLFVILASCKPKEKEYSQNNEFIEENIDKNEIIINNPNEVLFKIDFNEDRTKLAKFRDEDMIQNVTIIYRKESDVIENIDKIEPHQMVNEILDKPFENIESNLLLSYYSGNQYFNGIDELLNIFEVSISDELKEKFYSFPLWRSIKISIENLNIYVYRDYDTLFKLSIIEYDKNYFYKPKLKIGYTKNKIIELLGKPSSYSKERDVFVYESFKTLRQINIFFENDNIKFIQLIAYGEL